LFKNGREVDSVVGADGAKLEAKIQKHYVVPENSQGNGGGPSNSVSGYPDITSNVDAKNVLTTSTFTNSRWNV
jgi:hypothetical protein